MLKEPSYIIFVKFQIRTLRMVVQASATILFSLFYLVFCTGTLPSIYKLTDRSSGFICQFREFRGAGISPEAFLSMRDWLGSEEIRCELCFSVEMKHFSFLDF